MTGKDIFGVRYTTDGQKIKGPYAVIFADDEIVLVALDISDKEDDSMPCIGMGFVFEGFQHPVSSQGRYQWVVLPSEDCDCLINSFIKKDDTYREKVLAYFNKEIQGEELMHFYFERKINDDSVILKNGIICDSKTKCPLTI